MMRGSFQCTQHFCRKTVLYDSLLYFNLFVDLKENNILKKELNWLNNVTGSFCIIIDLVYIISVE